MLSETVDLGALQLQLLLLLVERLLQPKSTPCESGLNYAQIRASDDAKVCNWLSPRDHGCVEKWTLHGWAVVVDNVHSHPAAK